MNLYKLKVLIISFLFTLIPIFNLHAQWENVRFRHLTIEDGLSQNSVLCIVQDDMGFIWMGTKAGLNKYDGYTFTIYKADIYDTTSLSENHILSICKDHIGMLWIGTEDGLNRFDPEKERFTRYLHNPDDPYSLSHNRIYSICEDDNGSVWVGTGNGLNRFDQQKKEFFRYYTYSDNPKNLSNNDVRSVYIDKSGILWIGTYGGGLNRFDPEKEEFTCYKNVPGDPASLSNDFVLSIHEDNSGTLWIGTEKGGLNRFDREKETFIRYVNVPDDPKSISDDQINVIYEDRSGRLWIGTHSGGVSIFDREKENFFSFQNDPDNPTSLSGNEIYTIFEDNTGSIWIGSRGYGINIYNQEAEKFAHYKHEHQNRNSLSDNMVWGICEDRFETLWIGTLTGGLNRFDREKNIFTRYVHDNKNPYSINSNNITGVYEDRFGVLWIGTDKGLDKLIRHTKQFSHYKFDPDNPYSISNNKIRSIYEDRSGTLWVGTKGGGLNRFDRKTGHFIHYKHDPDDSTSISYNRVYPLYEDRLNNFWVGTYGGGLNKLNRKKGEFIHYKTDPKNINSLNNNNVLAIHEDASGNLWLGTYGGGLNKFDREKKIFTHYTEKDGLSNNEVYTILEDNKGYLWMSTNRGLSKFDPEKETFKVYKAEDGLQSDEFNTFAGCKSQNGELFFGGINGFNAFFPDSIKDNPFLPSIVITGFKLSNRSVPIGKMPDGRTILEKAISETKEIILSYKDKVISFEFTALHYTAPEKNQYAYIMEGLEEEWNYVASNRRFVTYTNLNPGKYVFRVKGSNCDGVWNEEGASLRITIIPPFWRTWWFYTLCAVIIIAITTVAYRYRINLLKKQREEEEHRRVTEIFSQVLDQGDAAVYRRKFDSDNYDYMGDGIKNITGYDPSEFSVPFWNRINLGFELGGNLKGLSIDEVFKRVRDGKVDHWTADIKIRAKSDEVRWIRDMATTLRDERGYCYACFGIFFDITDRKLAEQELARTSNELRSKKDEMESDLNMAREVQMALLSQNYPKTFPENAPGEQRALHFSHRYIPTSELAGDFFEILPISDHEIGVLIYDVMGHGVRASLLTAYLHGLIEELMPIATDTVAFMKRLNFGLNAMRADVYSGVFVTAFYLVADIKTGKVHYTNAGHPSPFLIQRNKNVVKKIQDDKEGVDPALALLNDHNYSVYEYPINDDDLLFFYTDGVYEVSNEDMKLFGRRRLITTVESHMHQPPEKMLDGVLDEIKRYAGTSEFADDLCMVTMHVRKDSFNSL